MHYKNIIHSSHAFSKASLSLNINMIIFSPVIKSSIKDICKKLTHYTEKSDASVIFNILYTTLFV